MSQKSVRPSPATEWNPANQNRVRKEGVVGPNSIVGMDDVGTTIEGKKVRAITVRQPGVEFDSEHFEIYDRLDDVVGLKKPFRAQKETRKIGVEDFGQVDIFDHAPTNDMSMLDIIDGLSTAKNRITASTDPSVVQARRVGTYQRSQIRIEWYGQFHGDCQGTKLHNLLHAKLKR